MRVKPIKGFVVARAASVQSQLDGTATGTEVAGMGFGGPAGGPVGGAPGAGPGGGPNAFGPGTFLGPAFMRAMDQDGNGDVARDECEQCFLHWHEQWGGESGLLSLEALRDGLNKTLMSIGPGGPGAPGGGE